MPDDLQESKDQQEVAVLDFRTGFVEHETLFLGKKLIAAEATQIRQANATQVVVLGGMVESGKTTLLARIFEMFQCGNVAGYQFAGSHTLIDFDKLSWYATMECGAAIPTTEHTYRSENNLFLHMRVKLEAGSTRPIDLLIADIPGEIFPEAVAEESVCQEICALESADHVVLFLDGGVLCDAINRHDHCGKVVDFVSRALQTRQIGRHTTLHLVVSKCDLLPRDETHEVTSFVKSTEAMFKRKFGPELACLYFWHLAARPHNQQPGPTLSEIDQMFGTWLTRSTISKTALAKSSIVTRYNRDFCRFGS